MKVLMFGWEFPPHISGGLGTACYGLTKSLSGLEDIEILFVVPKLYGDEDNKAADLVGAGDINAERFSDSNVSAYKAVETKEYLYKSSTQTFTEKRQEEDFKTVNFLEVKSKIRPYMSPEQYAKFIREKRAEGKEIQTDKEGNIYFLKEGTRLSIEEENRIENTLLSEDGTFKFSGKYGPNLMNEVDNYAKVASLIAEQYDFDIIHAHDWLTYAAGVAAKKVSGKPLVVHVHATEFDRSGEDNINTQVFAIEKYGMENADKIITVSSLTGDIVVNKYGVDSAKTVTVHNAVEPQEGEDKSFKKNVDEKIVTFLGRITYQKGPEYFLRAAKLVLDKLDNVRFVMAGNGDLLRKMIRYAAELKITDKFHFTDFLRGEEVTRMYAISDVYVMPSISEPFGISPLEAMRSNVPVIISKQSGVSEVLKNAIKVNYWDEHATADAIYGLIKYKGMADMLKRSSKPEVERIRWTTPAKKVKKIYTEILQNSN
ncbi:MAG: glycosyltransferase family 4 protein [Bacteroidota bacterium]|nr:glycosyltransferase family 4 protein [Bacteroidota bacterium]